MINKNKFSIKDTKKVLHKVGKRWVVVSAVLLGLAAGGAAVTNANADTTQAAAQPTAAQQVAKNANMSSANHSFGAADPVNATKAPASSATMKLGAADGVNGSINIKGHNVPTTKQGIKNDAKHYASYANVYNLSALASKADTNNAKSQYSDLVNLVSNAPSQFNSYEVGSDASNNSNANTLFGILNDASSDINAINNDNSNSKLTKISHALSDVQSLASYNSSRTIKLSVPNVPVPVSVGNSVALGNVAGAVQNSLSGVNNSLKAMGLNGISLASGTIFPVTPFSSTYDTSSAHASMSASVSVNIPSIINNGITESSADSLVSSLVHAFASTASENVTSNASAFAQSLASSNNLASQVANDIASSFVSSNPSLTKDATSYNNLYTAYSALNNAANNNDYSNNTNTLLDELLRSNPSTSAEASNIELAVKSNPKIMIKGAPGVSPIIPELQKELNEAPISSSELRSQLQSSKDVDSTVQSYISNLISGKLNENDLDPIIDGLVQDKIDDFLGIKDSKGLINNNGFIQSNIANLNGDIAKLYLFSGIGPFTTNNISNASHYIKGINYELNNLPSPFNKDQSKISKANAALDVVKEGIADASDIASDVANTPDMSSAYNAVVNSAANLASDLPNNVSAYNDYNDMYTNASLLASGLSTDHNRIANHIMTNVAVPASNIAQTYLTSDSIVFNDDPSANYTSSGIKGTTGTVYAPQDYHFNDNNSQETITFNGNTYTFNVTKNSATPSNPVQPINPNFIPTFNNGSSVNTYYEPSTVSGNANVESKARYANYVLVTKALQLHTNPNFTKRNGVAVVKPGIVLNVEKTVRARHNFVRYEVRYNNKNYFVTANKRFVAYNRYELVQPSHYGYAKVDTALQLHQSTNFTSKNGVKVVKPGTEFRINRVVKSNKGVTRYEVNYKDSVYFITTNAHYVENAYVQKSNFSKRGHKSVRAISPVNEYRHVNFSKRGLVRHFRRGTVLPVRRVFTIGNSEVTRLQLTNGRYVSANKDFVEPIR